MTLSVETTRFARAGQLLWRDTGLHVVVLHRAPSAEVTVLGGGSAALWRLLREPRTLEELCECFGADAEGAPAAQEVAACLDELHSRGVLEIEADIEADIEAGR